MLGDTQSSVREFRHLRRRLVQLQTEINSLYTMLNYVTTPQAIDSDQVALNLRLKTEEADEIQFVLQFFGNTGGWSTRTQAIFIVMTLIILALAFLALYKVV